MFTEGKLIMMKIDTFKDSSFEKNVGTIKVLINPESYKENYTINFTEEQAPGTTDKDQKFVLIKPNEFSIKLLFDSTGIFPKKTDKKENINLGEKLSILTSDSQNQPSSSKPFQDVEEKKDLGIYNEMEELKAALFKYDGDTHNTYYVRFSYAKFEKNCRVKKIDINYKMFNTEGYPIRAEVNLTCISTINDRQRKAKEEKKSPDLTHVRMVKEGDTLPLMTYDIYGNSKYYLEVARVNNLLNFRNLIPGQEIVFPPINKTQK